MNGVADHLVVVVGLGNPGSKYQWTRHNIGFLALDAFAERVGVTPAQFREKHGSLIAEMPYEGKKWLLMKPFLYMNRSGGPVQEVVGFYKVPLQQLVVLHDEVDIPFGELRLKRGGSDGGHNGLRSITAALGSGDYYRVRIGVGRPKSFQESTSGSEVGTQAPPPVLADWVLGEFGKQERDGVAAATARAVDATFELIKNGLERAQYRFNK